MDSSSPAINVFALSGCLTGLTSLVLGLFVLWANRSRPLNQAWFAFATAVGLWGIGSTWIALESNPVWALWAWRLSFAFSVVWIPILFFHFVCLLCTLNRPYLLVLSYGTGIGFFPFILFSGQFFSGVRFAFSSFYYAQPGLFLVSFFTILWLSLTVYSHALLIRAFSDPSNTQWSQIQYFFLVTAIGYMGGATEFLPIFGIDLYPWGHFAIPLYPVLMAYAIVRYRFMDIPVALGKSIAYVLLFAIAAVPGYGFLLWAQQTYFGSISYTFSVILFLTFLLVLLGSYTMKIRTEEALGRMFFKRRYEMFQTISTFSEALVTILDFKTLTDEIVRTLVQVLGIQNATLYVLDKGKATFSPVSTAGLSVLPSPSIRLPVGEALPRWLRKFKVPLVCDELEHLQRMGELVPILNTLRLFQAEVCLPFLNNKKQLIGFCILGHRFHRETYSQDELYMLTSLSQNAAIALDNAMMYEDLKQSQSLMHRIHRLRSLEVMAGRFAHEVRNPLTSIKTFIQLAPQYLGKHDFFRKFGKVVTDDIARIERLTQEILNYPEQLTPKVKPENLNEILTACVQSIILKIHNRSVEIVKDLGSGIPLIFIDAQQIQQVFLNLLSNALEVLEMSGGTILVRSRSFEHASGETWIQVAVKDSGSGMTEKERHRIFDPYFTTKNSARGGMGLGLTIVRQILAAHGGTIEVSSTVGTGTIFLVNFPVLRRQVPKSRPHI